MKLKVRLQKEKREIELSHEPGRTALQTMREGGVTLPSLCDGMGKCGKCKVRFIGTAPLPSQADRAVLDPVQLREGYRLACMARPMKDSVIETAFDMSQRIGTVTASHIGDEQTEEDRWEDRIEEEIKGTDAEKQTLIAVDIGTTTIAMELRRAASGKVLDVYTCLNPQSAYGTDVIARIRAGIEGHGGKLQQLVQGVLKAGIRQFSQMAEREKLCPPKKMVISCNTTMGHIFMGYPLNSLGQSPFQPVNIGAVSLEWEGLQTFLVPGFSAFVGGDILSGLYACGLCDKELYDKDLYDTGLYGQEKEGNWLFIDLGTNAEMAMGIGGRIVATAAAAGPAFEGRGRGGALGAERIAAIAVLLEQGILDETGLMREPWFEKGAEVQIDIPDGKGGREKKKVWITQEDIRDIQMAKGAVRTGIHFMAKALTGGSYEQIERVYVAGGLGFYLDQSAAARIGLVPEQLQSKMKTVGNTSLAGAGLLGRELWRAEGLPTEQVWDVMKGLEDYAVGIHVFNLAESPGFEENYINFMNF